LWVQEYGRPHPELVAGLQARGAQVESAAVYAWQLPEDLAPLERAIVAMCEGNADAVVFTSGQQVEHLLQVARKMGRDQGVRDALRRHVVVASIGPVTTAALSEHGIAVDLEPEHSKMGHLVKALVERGARALSDKQIASQ
jgi:uroporphyrinogen-III synthase